MAKYILDRCIQWNKHIVLSLAIEEKINIDKLLAFLSLNSKYQKFIHEIEIMVGKF